MYRRLPDSGLRMFAILVKLHRDMLLIITNIGQWLLQGRINRVSRNLV